MPSLGRPAGEAVRIAGGVDAAGSERTSDQRGDRADRRVGKRREARFDPAAVTSVSLLSNWMNRPAGRGDAGVGGGAEAAVCVERERGARRDEPRQPLGRAVGRGVVADDDLDRDAGIGRAMPRDAREAAFEQLAAVVGRDHDRTEWGAFGRGRGRRSVQAGFPVRFDSFHEVLPQKTC